MDISLNNVSRLHEGELSAIFTPTIWLYFSKFAILYNILAKIVSYVVSEYCKFIGNIAFEKYPIHSKLLFCMIKQLIADILMIQQQMTTIFTKKASQIWSILHQYLN